MGTRECRFGPIKEPEKYLPLCVHVVLARLRLVLSPDEQWKTGDDSLRLWLHVFFDGIEQDQSSVTSKWNRGVWLHLEDEGCVKHLAGSRENRKLVAGGGSSRRKPEHRGTCA